MVPSKQLMILMLMLGGLRGGDGLQAATLILNPVADTTLSQHDPSNNLGGEPTLFAGATGSTLTNRALFKFDVARSIPADSILQNATLTMAVVKTAAGVPATFSLHRILRDWGEGTGRGPGSAGGNLGSPATPGEATWLARFHPDVLWSAPGGSAPADFGSVVSASQSIAGAGNYTFSSSTLVQDVENWLTNAASNFGWILVCEDELTLGDARRFGSREDPPNAPTLKLEYIPPPKIEQTRVTGTLFQFSFVAEEGRAYVVQFRDSFSVGSWGTLTNLPPGPATQTNTVSTPVIGAQRFYRVGLQ